MLGTMKRLWVLIALAVPIALASLIAGGALAHEIGDHPDVAVTNVSVDPYPPAAGQEAQVVAEVENEGDDGINQFDYRFYVDGEAWGEVQTYGDEEDESLSNDDSAVLNATRTWTITLGDHRLNASVTHEDTEFVQEHNTDNNDGEQNYTIGPDLAVRNLAIDPSDPLEGDEVEFTATVENQAGDNDQGANVTDDIPFVFRVDGQQVGTTITVNGLAPGESETVTSTWTAEPGEHDVQAVADPDDTIGDRDTTNNQAGPETVDVRPALPDLVVSNVDYSPDPLEPDRQVTFTAEIANNGNDNASEHQVALLVDGETVDTGVLAGVDQDGTSQINLTWDAQAGNRDFEIQVDPSGEVTETNEENNAWTLTLPVGPDLVVREFVVQPSEPSANDRVRFTVEIGNDGIAARDTFRVAFDVDGEPLDVRNVTGLGPDEVRNVTSNPWNASVGDHNVTAIIDPEGAIDEVDDSNNRETRQLTVGEPQPDVTVLSAGLNTTLAADGDTVTAQAQVENAGPRDADAFSIEARVDGETIGDATVDGLDAGEQTTVDVAAWTATEGPHRLAVEADTEDAIEEIREDDNAFATTFGIGTDLAVVDLSVTPTEPEPGEDVTALAIVQNNGTQTTSPANVSFRLAGNEVARGNVSSLDANEETSLEATFTASVSGTIEAAVDPDEQIDEFDEDNNLASLDLELAGDTDPPDLTVRSVSVDGEIGGDDNVRFTAEIANVGEGPSGQALVDFRIDGSSIGSPVSVDGLAANEPANVTSDEWTTSDSEHELEVVVDPDEQVDESDETNNAHTRTLEGGPTAIPLGPGTAAIGLLAAAVFARAVTGSKRKAPKT